MLQGLVIGFRFWYPAFAHSCQANLNELHKPCLFIC
jgi:hypothetical protein